ncbi:hypothetical protein H0H87_009067 [Tephrocybe sp. NHM501043]|nr:hypothetical protein H0H87_009067 [Tephrocybe sp. NHM501043]
MEPINPTDYGAFVVRVIAQSTRDSQVLDQHVLRQCLGLSSSFLITDTTTNPNISTGIHTWSMGLNRLIDICVALHKRNQLDLETFNSASRACSECWTASGSWRGLSDCRDGVRTAAEKLKTVIDPNGRTYQGKSGNSDNVCVPSRLTTNPGQAVYAP